MRNIWIKLFGVTCFIQACVLAAQVPVERAIAPSDCVTVKYLLHDDAFDSSIQLSPNGARAAYLVKAPDLLANRNRIELHVFNLDGLGNDSPKTLYSDYGMSQIRWLDDGMGLAVLIATGHQSKILKINVITGALVELIRVEDQIEEYTIDRAGDTIAYAVAAKAATGHTPSTAEINDGYRVPFETSVLDDLPKSIIFLSSRSSNGGWSLPRKIEIASPLNHEATDTFSHYRVYPLNLSIAPNGKTLLFSYFAKMPASVETGNGNPYIELLKQRGTSFIQVMTKVDLVTGESSIPLKSPVTRSLPIWSADSGFFVVSATAPIGSRWEQSDKERKSANGYSMHLFSVEPDTEKVSELVPSTVQGNAQPLFITPDNGVIVRTSSGPIVTFAPQKDGWEPVSKIDLPTQTPFSYGQVESNGRVVIGELENASTPPRLMQYSKQDGVRVIEDLNPQFRGLKLAALRHVTWMTSTGYPVQGVLFLPPGYEKGTSYPLVIGTHSYTGEFVCDSGASHYPSFAPQPIADAGMLYLMREIPLGNPSSQIDEHPVQPGYPGGIGEAAFQMDVWDSAVKSLAAEGIVDQNKVGIIGFSRTGWFTEFILTHSRVPYRAATLTDNVEYSLGEYWLQHYSDLIAGWDKMYGGPPFGNTLKNWEQYSVSFNIDKIHAAVLMEEIGYGAQYDNAKEIPLNLAAHFELFTGLNRLHRAVELYYYPDEVHQPETPKARLSTLQRNLDWYRFWLQGYERPTPEDGEQYKRWEHLRELRDNDKATTVQSGSIQ